MRHLILTACVALGTAGVLGAALRGAEAAPKSASPDRALVVAFVAPSRNREVLPDLSDPGLNNVFTVRFSTAVSQRDLLDERNLVNGLSDRCEFHDQNFARVPGAVSVRRNVLTIHPIGVKQPVLPQGRYTLTLHSSIRSTHGRLLNDGRADFTTTFYAGSDVYPPLLLGVSPRAGQTGVGVRRTIVATFDEPLDPASAVFSVSVEDRRTEPPTPIPSRVRLARHGRDVVVTSNSRAGFPPNADLALVIAGQGTSTSPSAMLLTDAGGRAFARDASPEWIADPIVPALFHSPIGDFDDATGRFTMAFRTGGGAAVR